MSNYSSRATAAAVNSLVKHGNKSLAEQDWEGAADYYTRALEADPDCAQAHLQLYLASRHLIGLEELPGVARQIVELTPAERTPLAEVLARQSEAEGDGGPEAPADKAEATDADLEVAFEPESATPGEAPESAGTDASGPGSAELEKDVEKDVGKDVEKDGAARPTQQEETAAGVADGDAAARDASPLPEGEGDGDPSGNPVEASPAEERETMSARGGDSAAGETDDQGEQGTEAAPGEERGDSLGEAPESSSPDGAIAEDVAAGASFSPSDERSEGSRGDAGAVRAEARRILADPAAKGIRAPYDQRIFNLEEAKAAFDATFSDEDWRRAHELAPLDLRRHMERSRADADDVFSEAFDREQALLDDMCEVACRRVPEIEKIAGDAERSCEDALAEFERVQSERRDKVRGKYAFLKGNLHTARVSLWVSCILIVMGVVMLIVQLIPHEGTVAILAIRAFPEVFTPIALALIAIGAIVLLLRMLLVRANQQGMGAHAEEKASVTSALAESSEELDDRIAAVRARILNLQNLSLGASDEEFEDACEDLAGSVADLTGSARPGEKDA